jgi:hypothetical protein
MPLPDFFIGAHAKIMGWDLATADRSPLVPISPLFRSKCRNRDGCHIADGSGFSN